MRSDQSELSGPRFESTEEIVRLLRIRKCPMPATRQTNAVKPHNTPVTYAGTASLGGGLAMSRAASITPSPAPRNDMDAIKPSRLVKRRTAEVNIYPSPRTVNTAASIMSAVWMSKAFSCLHYTRPHPIPARSKLQEIGLYGKEKAAPGRDQPE